MKKKQPKWHRQARSKRKRSKFATYDPHYFTPAGRVTITKADGTVTTQAPLGNKEYQKLIKARQCVTQSIRQKVLLRDKGCCRYCGNSAGPFEIDHVVPVALGGSSTLKNLVTACGSCNSRKGAATWTPKPIGYAARR